MDVYFVLETCLLDGRHLEESKGYKTLKAFFGKEFADSFTFTEYIPIISHPPPEVMDDGGSDRVRMGTPA